MHLAMKRPKNVSVWIPPESVIRHLAMYMESMLIEHTHKKKRLFRMKKETVPQKLINQGSKFNYKLRENVGRARLAQMPHFRRPYYYMSVILFTRLHKWTCSL